MLWLAADDTEPNKDPKFREPLTPYNSYGAGRFQAGFFCNGMLNSTTNNSTHSRLPDATAAFSPLTMFIPIAKLIVLRFNQALEFECPAISAVHS
jgi:hypothetical protein